MNNQQILDGAPEGATHYSDSYREYLKVNAVRKSFLSKEKDGEWYRSLVHEDFRSLSDIQALADKDKRIAELERNNLEQQAKGIDWVLVCRELNLSEGEVDTLIDKYNQLRSEANQLKAVIE